MKINALLLCNLLECFYENFPFIKPLGFSWMFFFTYLSNVLLHALPCFMPLTAFYCVCVHYNHKMQLNWRRVIYFRALAFLYIWRIYLHVKNKIVNAYANFDINPLRLQLWFNLLASPTMWIHAKHNVGICRFRYA